MMNSSLPLSSVSTTRTVSASGDGTTDAGADEFASLIKQAQVGGVQAGDARAESSSSADDSDDGGTTVKSVDKTTDGQPALADAGAELLMMMGMSVAPVPPVASENATIGASAKAFATTDADAAAASVAALVSTGLSVADAATPGNATTNAVPATNLQSKDGDIRSPQPDTKDAQQLGTALNGLMIDQAKIDVATTNETNVKKASQSTAVDPAQRSVDSDTTQRTTSGTDTQTQSAVPEWLLKGFGDSAQQSKQQQMVLALGAELTNAAVRAQDKTIDNTSGRTTAASDSSNLSVVLSGLGNAVATQIAQDVNATQGVSQMLHSPVGSTGWAQELGNKLVLLSKQDAPAATLHVTPADLGPIQIRIETQHNQANVWFTADHPDTRSAIEQSLPRLREMFNAQGMMLNDAGVSGDRSGRQSTFTSTRNRSWSASVASVDGDHVDTTLAVRTLNLGMVDTYA
jgi:flagellar hook-length control protein FliK